jgi:hypothetical protein
MSQLGLCKLRPTDVDSILEATLEQVLWGICVDFKSGLGERENMSIFLWRVT